MTGEEKFSFDLEGYLIIKNVLSADEVAEMNEIADRAFPPEGDGTSYRRSSRVSHWGEPFRKLIDHPKSAALSNRVNGSQGSTRSRLLHLHD